MNELFSPAGFASQLLLLLKLGNEYEMINLFIKSGDVWAPSFDVILAFKTKKER